MPCGDGRVEYNGHHPVSSRGCPMRPSVEITATPLMYILWPSPAVDCNDED